MNAPTNEQTVLSAIAVVGTVEVSPEEQHEKWLRELADDCNTLLADARRVVELDWKLAETVLRVVLRVVQDNDLQCIRRKAALPELIAEFRQLAKEKSNRKPGTPWGTPCGEVADAFYYCANRLESIR